MSPNDMRYDEFLKLLKANRKKLLEAHAGGLNAARGDGSVSFMRTEIPESALKKALLIADGEEPEDF